MDARGGTTSGAGVIQKAAVLLRHIGDAGAEGVRLKDLAEAAGLPRPTVHRLLADLIAEQLIRQGPDRRYVLGQQLFELGLAAPNPVGSLERFRPLLRDLAVELGDVVYFSMRRGATMQYLTRDEGPYPIRTYTVEVGEMRRITNSYSGLAMLASMPAEASNRIITSTERHRKDAAMRLVRLVSRLRVDLRRTGYVAGSDLVLDGYSGIAGVAVTVPNGDSVPFLAVSASAISSRLPPSRYSAVAEALTRTAADVAGLVAEPGSTR